MAVKNESLDRMRESGRESVAKRAGQIAAYEKGRDDMWNCVAKSNRFTTGKAVEECRRKLQQ